MAEAEDVITDAARHATVFARDLWRRHRPPPPGPTLLQLADIAPRLDLLICAAFGRSYPIRTAQPPAPPTVLARLLQRQRAPRWRAAIAATDGHAIWLPATIDSAQHGGDAAACFRLLALRQAMRASRGSAAHWPADGPALVRDLMLLFEAHAADCALVERLPGLKAALAQLRRQSLASRPPLASFPESMQSFERFVRATLGDRAAIDSEDALAAPAQRAWAMAGRWPHTNALQLPGPWLWRDAWSGDLRAPLSQHAGAARRSAAGDGSSDDDDGKPPRSARLPRRPDVRESPDGEDDPSSGAWMVQTAAPQETAEDPMGLSRPTDRDTDTAAEDFADALSELPQARLISAPGKPKEVLLADEPPAARRRHADPAAGISSIADSEPLHYPEWDWRSSTYRDPGATVLRLPAIPGPQQWVDDTLAARQSMLHEIRRRFELLRAERVRLHRQLDGDRIDLPAFIDSRAAFRAGLPLEQRLYQSERRGRRDLAVLLLVDVSGSTDAFIGGQQRVIDVEREALLLVCIALQGLQARFSVQAFSGEGPQAVVMRSIKSFDEACDDSVARRIAGLEPEHYTRAGAALRHASALLMHEPAEHRLLLVLSDGKPNDIDDYEGRYGIEDMRQAVVEARLQGIAPFCLTVDRQSADYLPFVFGTAHQALLPRPELLPTVLLDWLRRLVAC
ncbi:MAG: VWA domain-containing protein [Rubrivivax sp.]